MAASGDWGTEAKGHGSRQAPSRGFSSSLGCQVEESARRCAAERLEFLACGCQYREEPHTLAPVHDDNLLGLEKVRGSLATEHCLQTFLLIEKLLIREAPF